MSDGARIPSVTIRQMSKSDIDAVVSLQRRIYPEDLCWSEEELLRHIQAFPEGQLVAIDSSDRIVGSASSLIIDWDDYAESAQWSAITGGGTFSTHNPLGKTLYGADMCVDPLARRLGIGTLFYEARKRMVRERSLKRLLTGGRIPGYAQVSQEMTPEEYVEDVVAGRRTDPTLSFQLANGLVVLDVVPEYLEDRESRHFATLLEWLNPAYVTSVSLQSGGEMEEAEEVSEHQLREHPRPARVRIAAMQYLLRPINRFEDFVTQVEFFVKSARDYRSHFVLFPEYFTMQLLSYLREPSGAKAVRRLAQLAPDYEALFRRLAVDSGLYIVGGTHPVIQEGQLFNAAHLFTPNGCVFRQKKVHLTEAEKASY
ncbi:MAG TPA: GNAT family N-acetyltransferase, partial [Candidatus Bathyarchaeia archaeon]|nr:GNAT family N-acetyltransferase [Candidatus Bathyarchaeia archaeon]